MTVRNAWMGGFIVLVAAVITQHSVVVGLASRIGVGQVAVREQPSDPSDLVAMRQMLTDLREEMDILEAGLVPSRTIVAWYPTRDDLDNALLVPPDGWLICDGRGGAPDLRDRFIYGTDSIDEVGDEDGAMTHDHTTSHVGGAGVEYDNEWSAAYQHSHTVSTVSHLPPLVKMVYIMKR